MTHLALSGVSYQHILRDIDADWVGGQVVGLIGPNGAGKSTLLRTSAGVLRQDKGSIRLDGHDLNRLSVRARACEIAYLPQQIPADVPFTAREFVAMGRYAHKTRGHDIVDGALEQMNLLDYVDAPMHTLSGGERQRAGIARCLAQESRVLLLDEPTASLDLYYQMDILQQLQRLAREGYLVVIAIHHLELAIRFCDQFLLLDAGRVYAAGEASEVISEQALADVFGIVARTYRDPFADSLRLSVFATHPGVRPK